MHGLLHIPESNQEGRLKSLPRSWKTCVTRSLTRLQLGHCTQTLPSGKWKPQPPPPWEALLFPSQSYPFWLDFCFYSCSVHKTLHLEEKQARFLQSELNRLYRYSVCHS